MKHTAKEWLIATRPWSFTASAMPVILTFCCLLWAGRDVNLPLSLWALASVVLFHAAGNTWSDYFDFVKGVDRAGDYCVPTLTSGRFKPNDILWLSLCLLAAALASGLGLMLFTGFQLFWVGLMGLACSLFYPYFKYRALGDITIFLAYAILPALGTSFVATGGYDAMPLIPIVPVGLITVAILHTNNTRDMATDAKAGIRTFASSVGKNTAAVIYAIETLLPFLLTLCGVAASILPLASLLVLLALPLAAGNVKNMSRFPTEGSQAIAMLDLKTAKLQLVFSCLLSAAFLVSWAFK